MTSILLSQQKTCFVTTNMCLSWQKWYFVATKVILVAALANDTDTLPSLAVHLRRMGDWWCQVNVHWLLCDASRSVTHTVPLLYFQHSHLQAESTTKSKMLPWCNLLSHLLQVVYNQPWLVVKPPPPNTHTHILLIYSTLFFKTFTTTERMWDAPQSLQYPCYTYWNGACYNYFANVSCAQRKNRKQDCHNVLSSNASSLWPMRARQLVYQPHNSFNQELNCSWNREHTLYKALRKYCICPSPPDM